MNSVFASLKAIPPARLSLLASVLLVIVPHLTRLPIWLGVVCIGAIVWRGLFELGRLRLPGRWLRLSIVILAIAGLAISFHTLVGRQAGSALLVMLLSLKLLEMHRPRDFTVVIFLSFFVVVIGFLFSQSIFMALYMLLAVIMLLATLVSITHQTSIKPAQYGFTRDLGHATRMFIQAAPIALLLFILFPRVPGPLWGLPQDAASARTGLSDEMEPGLISRLMDSNEVAFRVKFETRVPLPANRYWRGPVLWQFDGQKWAAGLEDIAVRPQIDLAAAGGEINYTVTLEPHNRYWLFALDLPGRLPPEARLTSDFQLLARRRVEEIKRYPMVSFTQYRLDADRRPETGRYLRVPSDAAPQTRALVAELRGQSRSAPGYVDQVLNYFQQEDFYYSREAPLLFNDPVDEFLFDTRVGFCEHYASAFTVMMRLGGIPARVVTGYHGGEMNPLSDYMIVRQSDAHAWSEVWLEGQGWVRIDPTGVIPPSRIRLTADLLQRQPQVRERVIEQQDWLVRSVRQAAYAWDAMNNRWNQWIIGYNRSRQSKLFTALGVPEIGWRGLTVILGLSIGVVTLILATALLRQSRRKTDPAKRLYQRALAKLARLGIHKRAGETPSQFCQRASATQPALAGPLAAITRQYLLLRYAPLEPPRRDALLGQLRASIGTLRTRRRAPKLG